MTEAQERIDALDKRLQDGFDKIGQAMQDGQNTRDWEALWVELLREYELLSDELAAAVQVDQPIVQASLELGRIEVAA